MKRIGILTFWNVPNYGTFLQAYALRNVIAELFPEASVEQIAYLDKLHYAEYYGIFNRKYRLWPINPKFYLHGLKRMRNIRDISSLKSFLEYYKTIPHTKSLTADSLKTEPFDTVVLGSDIIWDYSLELFNKDPFLFGNYLNTEKVISYAASFGTVKENYEIPEYVKNGIMGLSCVSVREENSAKLVESITGEKPQIVIDPTFLWDFAKDTNVVMPKLDYKYMIVYGSHFTQELIDGACKYAKENGLKILCLNSLNDSYEWCDVNIRQDSLNPYEWLGYFAKAETVFTCTFHGLMFGLIYNKKTAFCPTQFILDKALSFIRGLNLEEVLVKRTTFEEKMEWEWDYERINTNIAKMRNESKQYLINALTDTNI